MIVTVQPGLWLILLMLVAGVAFVVSIVTAQSRAEARDASVSAEEEWAQVNEPQLSRADFALYRLLPMQDWTKASFVLEDENRNRLGSYISQSRVRADLQLRGNTYQMFIQRAGAFASKWAGKVGASSPSAIVIRTPEQVLIELLPVRKFPARSYTFIAAGQEYCIQGGGWFGNKPRQIFHGSELSGVIRRSRPVSRKLLLALRRQLPDPALLAIVVASILQ